MDRPPPPPPPASFSEFDFNFDTSFLANGENFNPPPPMPPSAEMFAPEESATLLGFLDNFAFDFLLPSGAVPAGEDAQMHDPMAGFHLRPPPLPPSFEDPALAMTADPMLLQRTASAHDAPAAQSSSHSHGTPSTDVQQQQQMSLHHHHQGSPDDAAGEPSSSSAAARKKAPVPSSQKRLNHIASEQKRRNMIRDGYATLTVLLAPAGTKVENAMPRRGRPRGSGARGRGLGKGKSGVLFRAVEYIAWLQENCDALEEEITRVESVPPSVR